VPDAPRGQGGSLFGDFNRRVSGLEILAALAGCAVLIYVKAHHDAASAEAPAISRRPPVAPVALPAQLTHTAVRLHSRFVSPSRLELWGTAEAPDGATVRLSIKTGGTTARPLASAPVTRGHFYATARVPKAMRAKRVTVRALLAG
jgi:hypothetical protein